MHFFGTLFYFNPMGCYELYEHVFGSVKKKNSDVFLDQSSLVKIHYSFLASILSSRTKPASSTHVYLRCNHVIKTSVVV